MDIANIIDRVEFIKGHIISDNSRDALQQVKELLSILRNEEAQQLEKKIK